ncbi:MAG: hypothetical protein QM728_13915 [Gordonia sp. (in: high G+C Gram-positive bacteria)]|uniref:hypothetical protein n=1 Tax=Gordonia sp. (in: high G+C Gram-positive bacteria) TaxID=84139 RepID=UPI0039E5C123
MAAVYLLDATATDALVRALPSSHTVSAGVIRTFSPRVELDIPEDRLRHRMLFPDTLARALSPSNKVAPGLARRHAESTRLRFIERELPRDVRRGIDLLRKAEAAQQRSQAVSQRVGAKPSTPEELPGGARGVVRLQARLAALVKRWVASDAPLDEKAIIDLGTTLEVKATEVALLEEQLDSVADENSQLREELEAARSQFEELLLAATIAEDEQRKAERHSTRLTQQLAEIGRLDQLYVEPDGEVWEPPDGIYELLDRITPGSKTHRAFDRVVFTGDEDLALEIEKRGQGMRYAHAFWDYVHVLYDYAEGKSDGVVKCGVHSYLTSDHLPGHKCSPERHASTESETTLNRWGKERVFTVPKTVDKSGKILMDAHFRPTHMDTFAPRMHYHDDVHGTGKIYIGYIGRHLRNTKS